MGPAILRKSGPGGVRVFRLLGCPVEDSESHSGTALFTWVLPSMPRAGYNQLASTLKH